MMKVVHGFKYLFVAVFLLQTATLSAQVDLHIQQIFQSPMAACSFTSFDSVKFEVQNLGSSPSNAFIASYKWANLPWHDEHFTQHLPPNTSGTFKFSQGVWLQATNDTLWLAVVDAQSLVGDTLFQVTQPAITSALPHFQTFAIGHNSNAYCQAMGNATEIIFLGQNSVYGVLFSQQLLIRTKAQSTYVFDTIQPTDVWREDWNPEFLAIHSFRVDPGDADSLRLRFNLLQITRSLLSGNRMCFLRVVVNGVQVGPTFQPNVINNNLSGQFITYDFAIDSLVRAGNPVIIEFQSKIRHPMGNFGQQFNATMLDDIFVYNKKPVGLQLIRLSSLPHFPIVGQPIHLRIHVRNIGQNNIQNISLSHDLNASTVTQVFPVNLPFSRDTVLQFTLTAPARTGLFRVIQGDLNGQATSPADTLWTELDLLPEIQQLPYCEDFDQGTNGWIASHSFRAERGGSWTLGRPNKGFLQNTFSGNSAWYVGVDSTYPAFDSSALYLPAFNVQKDSCYRVRFMAHWLYDYWNNDPTGSPLLGDGFTLESSTNGRVWINLGGIDTTEPTAWFNTMVFALSDFNMPFPYGRRGWSAKSNGFLPQEHVFKSSYDGKLFLRFRTGSDDAFQAEGAVIDDFCFEKVNCNQLPLSVQHFESGQRVKLYPNPSTYHSTLQFEVTQVTEVKWRILDIRGIAMLEAAASFEPGKHELQLDLQGFAPGTYIVQLNLQQHWQQFRLVKQ
jgi:hypothetical protein